jgi:hypothetical protein
MDTEAARRARRQRIKWDLLQAFSDEEACPPDWLDTLVEVDAELGSVRERVTRETERFVTDPDIKRALRRRERVSGELQDHAKRVNTKIRRLNLIVPLPRFQRTPLDPEELVRPLFQARRRATTP